MVLPKAEQLLRSNVQPYISSILEALMEPTSRGFSEVRDVFFKELVEISKNSLNGGGKEKLGEVRHGTKDPQGSIRGEWKAFMNPTVRTFASLQ